MYSETTADISRLKLKQLQHESDTWKRSVGFMTDENVQLKNRLAEILRADFDENLLEDLEHFQTNFIREDEMIRLLKTDIAELDNLLVRGIVENRQINENVNRMLREIRSKIILAEAQFGKLKLGFNSYMLENLQ
jgi:hypothetical protein